MGVFARLRQGARVLWRGRGARVCPSCVAQPPPPSAPSSSSASRLGGRTRRCSSSFNRSRSNRLHQINEQILSEVKKVNWHLRMLPKGHRKAAVFGEITGTAFACAFLKAWFEETAEYVHGKMEALKACRLRKPSLMVMLPREAS